MKKLPPGIRLHGAGYQTVVKVRGERAYAQWPLDTPIREMTEWQKDTRATLRTTLPGITAGTFAADATKYLALAAVKAMPTYRTRTQHIREWVALFGSRRRRSISVNDIEEAREQWLADGYAASSVNHRIRALSNLWAKLDGRRAPNPVREVSECEEPDPQARGLTYDVIEAILAEIPDTWIGKRKDGTRTIGKGIARPSQTKARLRVIAYTGLTHAQLKNLTPDDVDLEAGTIRLVARRKGRKIRRAAERPLPELLPLLPQAVAAFKEFDRLLCWGAFSTSSMRKAFVGACERLNLIGLRPYDFRHSMLTAVYTETRDLRVTGLFGGHRDERTTKRYTMAAVAPHVRAAIDQVAQRMGGASVAPAVAPADAEASGIDRILVDATNGRRSS